MNHKALLLAACCTTPMAQAAEPGTGGWLDYLAGPNLSIGGFIRSETAFTTSNGKLNPFNQTGDPFNGVATPRNGAFGADTATRSGENQSQIVNLQLFRGEVETKLRISDSFNAVMRVRGVFDPAFYEEYNDSRINSQAAGRISHRPDYFQYDVDNKARGQPLEWSGRQYLIDLPALVLEYSSGALSVRAGVQQIAWGQAIFFRVLDVPNGLDFRRHSVLDFASEEFSDKRVPALAIRTSYQISDDWLVDAYVQKFQPTVYGNPNTSYNVIPSAFTVHDRYGDVDNKISYGALLEDGTNGFDEFEVILGGKVYHDAETDAGDVRPAVGAKPTQSLLIEKKPTRPIACSLSPCSPLPASARARGAVLRTAQQALRSATLWRMACSRFSAAERRPIELRRPPKSRLLTNDCLA